MIALETALSESIQDTQDTQEQPDEPDEIPFDGDLLSESLERLGREQNHIKLAKPLK